MKTEAWVLPAGPADTSASGLVPGELVLESITLPDPAPDDVLVEPLYGSWEANMDHALARSPVDVCRQRGEDRIVLGNAGVVRVLRPGSQVTSVREGDLCMVMPFTHTDRLGYVKLVYAYDAPRTVGILAKRAHLAAHMLLPVPRDTAWSLPQWAAYGRYFTAWDNWKVAEACWRAQVGDVDPAAHLVFSWGGGVGLAEVDLARRLGFRTAMTASKPARLEQIAAHGVQPVDRRAFADLNYDPERAKADPRYFTRYRESEDRFLGLVRELSDGEGVAIFVDNIGAPLHRATLKALARQGVITTAGWKHGMHVSNLRAIECISRHVHVHSHVWRFQDSAGIRDYQASAGWLPDVDGVYSFPDIPLLAKDYSAGTLDTYFPVFQVNPE